MPNRLADATSPYLQQHKDNPVDWWPWSEDAFAEARRRGVPILLSVGYAACHWCHVMAHESFEDEQVASKINNAFVPIKVDREERPDVDAVYMQATQAMTGQGGWPMTVFLTPAGDPIHAGTYFPPLPMHGLPSFGQVLDAVSGAWHDRREEISSGAADISRRLAEAGSGDIGGSLTQDDVGRAVQALAADFDQDHAGFGAAPKFPPSMVIEALLRFAESWPDRSVRDQARDLAVATLQAMASGGIHDQLAGGFARYSVDSGWVVPHFEKMLYDNGLLLAAYLHGWRLTGDAGLRRVAIEIVEWLLEEMITEQGAFAASLDADSRGPDGQLTEGAFYLWNRDQLHAALGVESEVEWVEDHCGVAEYGPADDGFSTLQLKGVTEEDQPHWQSLRTRLAQARSARPRPGRDDKIIVAWNALVIDALAEAGALLQRPEWTRAAVRAATTIWQLHRVDGRLVRSSRNGKRGSAQGGADDHALLALSFVRLAEVTGDPVWADRARQLLAVLDDHFSAPDGGFYDTADDAETLINRPKDPTDNAAPSGLSAAVHALRRLATYTGEVDLARRADRASDSAAKLITAAPRFAGWLLADAVSRLSDAAVEVAIVGDPADPRVEEFADLARRRAAAGSVIVTGPPDTPNVPLLSDRTMIDNRPTGYVCRSFVCRFPVTDLDDLAAQLADLSA
ncbi:thioredoxin domain-containing protein [Microlunatus elymi]|uniref:Thioredoxin domain-containing protein n=1 Tax=Microlunatus elymi TaxID=2596828 RepID=A0A516Q3U5_9ACTN|nr:thioredoxin domain-containing protein [Microlunatus elymi]QDP97891.1 thioredoxin domain-containing protein [Microlunatus elymi]